MMTDWSAGVESRNYGIARRPDSRSLVELLASMLCILLVAGALAGYVWIRCRIVALGYQVQSLKEQEQSLIRTQKSLICEEAVLKSPERIDSIARNDLRMEPLGPYQRIVPGFREADAGAGALALANGQALGSRRGGSSANN